MPSAEFPVALPCPPPTLLNLETSSSGAAGGSQDGFLSYCRLRYAMPMPLFFWFPPPEITSVGHVRFWNAAGFLSCVRCGAAEDWMCG